MQSRLAGVAALTVCLLLVPVPATAGGWWASIQLDKEPVAVGETVTATATVLFASIEEAREAVQDGGYHAYLVQGVDRERLDEAMTTAEPGRWWTVPPTTIHLAEVEFSGTDANLSEARATFTVPDVEPGLYGLMFCSEGCTEPMGDVIPSLDLAVHGDALLAHSLRTLGSDTLAESHLTMIEDRLEGVGEDVQDLRGDLEELLHAPASAPSPSPTPVPTPEGAPAAASAELSQSTDERDWLVVAAAFVAGATLAGMAMAMRQRRRAPELPEPRVVVADADGPPEPVGAPLR